MVIDEPATQSDADIPAEYNLDIPEDILALVEMFDMEWHNGGFAQLLRNWAPADVALIPQALRTIGSPEGAGVVADVIAALGAPGQWRDQGRRALLEPSDPLASVLWEASGRLDSHIEALDKHMAAYERKLARANGDPFVEDEDET